MFIKRHKPLPQHHILSSVGVGGQTGKSTTGLMLSAFLSVSAEAHTVAFLDAAAPRIGAYDCFRNIFGVTHVWGHTEGCRIIKAPHLDGSQRNLLIVRVSRQIKTWQDQTRLIQAIQDDLIDRPFKLTHIITETNLQPDDEYMPSLFTDLEYGFMTFWAIWKREAISSVEIAQDIAALQDDYPNIRLQFVHNPCDETRGRTKDSDYEAMKLCYEAKNGLHQKGFDVVMISERAREAEEKGLLGNDFWKFVYAPYLGEDHNRPSDLLPIYRRSEALMDIMPGKFVSITPIKDPQKLPTLLNDNSDGLYTNIYAPQFSHIGV